MVYTADVGDNRALFLRADDGAKRVNAPRIREDDTEIDFTAGSDGSPGDLVGLR